ncbi:WD40 repeat-like protein [Suillus paluster]|uniref:WD40 repeat-like protein n=1 Tax=Suillus paluster TaxID=48578 RepID=UPI001B86693F|nr:WD40 repeat-like protein [Suillus paluster]KAG1751494.1 WD40 repeat-like protein [Suillus paluster]
MASSSKAISNSAHQQGQTCIAFSRDGKIAYTGGLEASVRIWHTDQGEDQEPEAAYEADEGITTIAAANDYWLSGGHDSQVRKYLPGKAQFEGFVAHVAGASIRSLAVDPSGKRVAVASDELSVKIIDLDEITNVTVLEGGHKKLIRKTTWHPSGSILTTSSSDGTIVAWNISDTEAKVENVIDGIIPAVADSESPEFMHDCSAVWHPSGQYFFAASRTHEIVTISRTTWIKTSSLSDPNTIGATTALAVSANGVYLASACNQEILVWSVQTKRVLWRHPGTPNAFTIQIAFSPTENLLAWTDTDGVLSRWRDAIPDSSPDPVRQTAASSAQGTTTKRKSTPPLWGEEADVDAEGGDPYGDDWIIDDLGNGMEDEPEGARAKRAGDGFVKEMVSITKAQPAFQPGSTPMENKKRYLAYNMVGVIEVTDQDTHHIVNVEFHDRSTRKGYHFTDHFKYDLGSLGERGALFACPPELDHPAQVIYKPYGTWSTQGEWTYALPKGHRVLGLAAGGERPMRSLRDPSSSGGDIQGQGNIVIATSSGDLTFLSGSGMERIVLGVEGEYVTMAAAEEYVLVVHRPGATTIDGSQSLVATLISFEDFQVLQEKPLPIPKGHTLRWIGTTDEGAPAIYDSAGYMHLMIHHRRPNRAAWARLMDTNALERKQGKDESYWPVGLSQDTLCSFPVRLPFRNQDPVDSPVEERIARERIYVNLARDALGDELTSPDIDKREIELDKQLIKLIQAACKTDKAPRVIELVKRLHFPNSITAASQLAGFYQAIKLWREQNATPAEEAREGRQGFSYEDAPLTRPKPFQNFNPPPKVDRPGLTRSAGIVEPTEFTASSAAIRASRTRAPQASTSRSTSPEGKRKRNDNDDDLVSNTRAVGEPDAVVPSPKPNNPFARKTGQEVKKNPFARKPELNKPIEKSESFFNKVEVAEKRPAAAKGKEKEKKELSRQSTLFAEKKEKQGSSKKKRTRQSPPADSEAMDVDSQAHPDPSDVQMDTQPLEDEEPIDWPDSPPAATVNDDD